MPIIGSNAMYIQMDGIFNGVNTTNILPYYLASGTDQTPYAVLQEFIDTPLNELLGVTSEHMSYTRVQCSRRGPAGGLEAIQFINQSGEILGEAMPPNVVYSYRKVPDNANLEGTNQKDFRVGGLRLSGVPEIAQAQGILTDPYIASLNLVGDSLRTLSVGDATYVLWLRRDALIEGGPPQSAAPVLDLNIFPLLGTQNTRKY